MYITKAASGRAGSRAEQGRSRAVHGTAASRRGSCTRPRDGDRAPLPTIKGGNPDAVQALSSYLGRRAGARGGACRRRPGRPTSRSRPISPTRPRRSRRPSRTKTGDEAVLSFGSTGQLYTQITQGAPFEVFLAADDERPKKAVDDGARGPGQRFHLRDRQDRALQQGQESRAGRGDSRGTASSTKSPSPTRRRRPTAPPRSRP